MKINRVLIDMDGVVADFGRGACQTFKYDPDSVWERGQKGPFDFFNTIGLSEDYFWEYIDKRFWATLPKTEEADAIMEILIETFGFESLCFLSSPPRTKTGEAVDGKILWLERHFPRFAKKRRFLMGPAKKYAAGPGSLLVDDLESNVNSFYETRGEAILVPRPWNNLYEDSKTKESVIDNILNKIDLLKALGKI